MIFPLPCKKCKNKDISTQITLTTAEYYCYCDNCGARGAFEETEEKAIGSWNFINERKNN